MAPVTLSPALIAPLPDNKFSNKLASDVSLSILRNPTYCYFASFSIV